MANKKIKGITIQLGADTSALDKALKDVDSTSASLNKELGQVNKLLKFDPGNTQLLAQKQKILAESTENTKKKLDALKQAQGEVEKMFKSGDIGEKEYREFQRTLTETEQSLHSYKVQAERMETEQKKLKESTKQLDTLFEATEKSIDDFQDILGTKLANALRNGTANSDDLTIAVNKIGKAALGADTDLGKMRTALNQIDDSGVDEVRRSLQELKTDSGDTEDALNNIGEGIASGNLMEAGEQIGEFGDKVIEIGQNALDSFQNLEDATIKVNSRFDATGETAQKNADLIKNVYESGLGDSLDSVANAVILVKDNIKDLNDADLENIISQGMILEDTYGIDMSESMRGVNGLMEHFGLNATDAMDMLVAGTQGGLDKTNELGDNLSEYSGKFAEAGYSAEEYFQLLQNGLDNGAYNLDKVNDAINEVTTRIADGTIADSMSKINEKTGELEEGAGGWSQSVEDVFKQWQQGGATQKEVIDAIVQDIQGTENQQDKLNKAALAFGTMAEDGSMKFISALTSVGDSYTDVDGKAAKFQEDTTTSSQEMEAAMRTLSDALLPIGEDIQKAITPVLEFISKIAKKFADLPEPVRNFIEVIGGIAAVVAVITPIIATVMAVNGALVSLVGVGLAPIIGIVAAVAAAIAAIIVVIKNWGAVTDWLSDKWSDFKEWISEIWEGISDSVSEIWDKVKNYFADLWDSIAGKASDIWNSITDTVESIWNGIVDFFEDTWDKIYSIIEIPLNLIKSIIEGAFYAIYAVIYTVWEVIKAGLSAAWTWIKDTAAAIFNPIADFFKDTWESISSIASEIWENIKEALQAAWDWISSKASEIFTPLANFFRDTWNGIKDTVSGVWNTIKDTLGGIWDGIKTKATDVFGSVWKYIKDGFNTLKDTLGGIVKGIANGIIEPIGKAINGVINGVNWILDKVGSDKKFASWEVPHFAKGTGGIKKDTIGVVNDQKGSVYKEMVVPPNGKPFIPAGRDVVLPLKKGTKIMPARETKNFLESLPHFAGGIGDFFGGIWDGIKDFTGNVWDYMTHPSKIVQIALDKFTDLSGIMEPWLSVATGAVGKVFDGVVDFIKGIFDTQSNVNYNPTAGVEQWRTLAKKALQMEGQYTEANLERLLYQMQTESGGNPNAINNWDINAINGTPSKGLLQVIDPTFRAYARPGFASNIWDPLSNMLASIRYAVSRYGSLAAAYRGVGYEEGVGDIDLSTIIPNIPTLDVRWFQDGGILTKPALFDMGNNRVGGAGEAGPEAIAPLDKLKGFMQDAVLTVFGDKEINITMNISNILDGKTVARQTVKYTKPLIEEMDKFQNQLKGVRN